MPKRLATTTVLCAAALSLFVLMPAASSAKSPWWQILTGSRPTNLWIGDDNEQEIETELTPFFGEDSLAGKIEVAGKVVGCLGSANGPGMGICEGFIGFPAATNAAQLETVLEAAFETSAVQVSGGPVGGAPFLITVAGSGAPSIAINTELEPGIFVGSAKVKVLAPGGSGRLVSTMTNLGDAPLDATKTPLKIVDELPEGAIATGYEAFAGNSLAPVKCTLPSPTKVECTFEGELPSYESVEIEVFASLIGNPPSAGAPGRVSISGGDALPASAPQSIKVSPEKVPFGIESFAVTPEEEGGGPVTRAGAHPFQVSGTIQFNSGTLTPGATRDTTEVEQPAQPRNLHFALPAGLVGKAVGVPVCEGSDFFGGSLVNECPDESAVGVASVTIIEPGSVGFRRFAVPLFNLRPARGEPARFGFTAAGVPLVIDLGLDPDNKYRLIADIKNATQLPVFLSGTLALWGTPGDPRHDSSRGWNCTYQLAHLGPCERPTGLGEDAFIREPVLCGAARDFTVATEPWNSAPGAVIARAASISGPLAGCNNVPFDPSIEATPTSKLAENPSGLSFSVKMPNSGLLDKDAIAEGQPRKVEVELPEGMTLNPSAAEGLAVCSPSDYARERFDSTPGEGCPEASKLGNVEVDTPLIEDNPKGALYIAKSYENPFSSLLALYIVARSPERGILIKLPVKVTPDPKTGQLIATVEESPQTPFSSFDLSFREGARAPLVTPPACGDYEIKARFTPWSGNEVVTETSSFAIQHGVDGGACPKGGVPPFHPDFQAGSLNNDAGSHTEFDMRLIRKDGEQDMTRFSAILPPGVVGKLAGLDKCSPQAAAAAEAKSGREEIANPSCPANSEIGRSFVGAGVGSVLSYVRGKIYLGGPLNGDPLSAIAINPVVAGPFDVGTVVVQEALTLNPKTAEVEVDGAASDPIPHILQGIPTKLRDLRVYVDRPDFIVNPTSCEESSARSTLFGSYLDVLDPADDKPVDLSTRFQAANCANLGFKPKLDLDLKGGTERGGHPGLKATYRPRKGDANVKGLVVRLPRSAFLDQAHIKTICTRVQFAADSCPKAARYGYIKAFTPLLDEPLQGPVWLRSSNHKLPDLVFDLHGIVDIEVAVRIDSAKGGIRATVDSAPDAPLSKVELKMQGAKKGLIINSRNLCQAPSRANVEFSGHNGKEANGHPLMQAECGGKRKGKG
jgi:hypothetical protein